MSLITLIRHGETTWNADRRVQGQLEAPLSELGQKQAAALAARLKDEKYDALYSSDLSRAYDTAAQIASASVANAGMRIKIDGRLRERHYGVFQGLTWVDIKAKFPDDYARYRSLFPGVTIPGGESMQAFSDRVLDALEEIASGCGHALIVAHGGLVDIAYRKAMGIADGAPRDYSLPNASINRFRVDGSWQLESFGDVAHLGHVH